MIDFVRILLLTGAAYATAGLLFAIGFHWRGLHALDAGTHRTGVGFRLLITPGIVALWPLIALRWHRVARGGAFLGEQDSPISQARLRGLHLFAWRMLAVALPLLLGAALWWRPHEVQSVLPTFTQKASSTTRP